MVRATSIPYIGFIVVFPILTEAVKNKDYNLIAHLIETQDPYEIKRVKMPVMTSASSPNLVASDASSRMIGCVCEPVADAINWMELVKGDPVKCYCGHWFQLVSYEEYFRRVNCPTNRALFFGFYKWQASIGCMAETCTDASSSRMTVRLGPLWVGN
ncbi:hypothetical protein T265_06956 [Opisthorchis viverrini]|uniref:Cytochrome c oxidase subunit Vb n=2 Tax=Opisthorchis viverrini TaxID=6198 RepID=A0A074ZQI6_OPIVI|nr:hypothetical protein T265_06956 [Opisthorchis viverrini]KER25600.1 hypothetical protein T265_06956 [Opisthorchis viverrini]